MQILTCNELDILLQSSLPLGVITANYLLPSYLVPGILLFHTSPLLLRVRSLAEWPYAA